MLLWNIAFHLRFVSHMHWDESLTWTLYLRPLSRHVLSLMTKHKLNVRQLVDLSRRLALVASNNTSLSKTEGMNVILALQGSACRCTTGITWQQSFDYRFQLTKLFSTSSASFWVDDAEFISVWHESAAVPSLFVSVLISRPLQSAVTNTDRYRFE